MTNKLTPNFDRTGAPYTCLTMGDWQGNPAGYQQRYGYFRCEFGIAAIQQWRWWDKGKPKASTDIVVVNGGWQLDRSWPRIHPNRTLSRLARQMLVELA